MTKKALPLLVLTMLLCAAASIMPSAARAEPDNKDVLLMKQTLLTLWNMGLTSSMPMDAHELCGVTLRFLIRNQIRESVELREDYPERFTNIPDRYIMFFDRDLVEKTAQNVFNDRIDPDVPYPGVFPGAEGYYVDSERLHGDIFMDENIFLPGYAAVESLQQQADGTVILSGKLRRFKKSEHSDKEILWGAAPFMARFVPVDDSWRLVSFIITEEAMG